MIILTVVLLFLFLYTYLILSFLFGWKRLKETPLPEIESISKKDSVSVIVAFRNESENLKKLIADLKRQNYPSHLIEVILVDDNSSDGFEYDLQIYPFVKLISLDGVTGKKAALHKGISIAENELILFTDADCRVGKNWVLSVVNHFIQSKAEMILSPVFFISGEKPVQKYFELEFASLIASTAGSAGMKKAIMANGANLAVRKSSLSNLDVYKESDIASGDDVFLLHKFKKEGRAISFNKSVYAVVETQAPQTVKKFINQRLRWTSKSAKYKDIDTISAALVVFLLSAIQFMVLILSFFDLRYFYILGGVIILKIIIDALLLVPVLKYYNRYRLVFFIPEVALIYYIYVTLIVIASPLFSFKWKERK